MMEALLYVGGPIGLPGQCVGGGGGSNLPFWIFLAVLYTYVLMAAAYGFPRERSAAKSIRSVRLFG